MYRVRQGGAQQRPLSRVDELPDTVVTTEDAPVEVDANHDDVLDAALLEERQQLVPVVRYAVGRRDLDRRDLTSPGIWGTTFRACLARLAGAGSLISERGGERCLSRRVPSVPVHRHR